MNPIASVRYGVDAPGVVRVHAVFGSILAALAAMGFAIPRPNPIPTALNIGAALVAALLLFLRSDHVEVFAGASSRLWRSWP